jgi:hypothetical protein
MLTPEQLAELDYEACQQEKRDKLNSRLQVWQLLIGLVGAFGLASIQAGGVAYVVCLYPLLAACVARYAGHSEGVLGQLKAYLLKVECSSDYSGYETFNKASKRAGAGSHMRALRDAILLTDLLAAAVVELRLLADGWLWLAVLMAVVVSAVMIVTCHWLKEG